MENEILINEINKLKSFLIERIQLNKDYRDVLISHNIHTSFNSGCIGAYCLVIKELNNILCKVGC